MQHGTPENPFTHGSCEVCGARFKILLRHVGGSRTRTIFPLFYCMECESLTCVQNYRESDEQLRSDVEYNVNLLDRKLSGFSVLARALVAKLGAISHADVGCNIGALVKSFRDAGFRSSGYDLNRFAITKGKELFPALDLYIKPIGSDGRSFDLITMIDVLEHIAEPLLFMQDILRALNRGGHLFILVPRVDRDSWNFLSQPIVEQINWTGIGPFRDNDVHVVHYSTLGLRRLAERLGLTFVADSPAAEWPCNGILLRE